MFALRRKEALKQSDITHVLSVIRMPLDQDLFNSVHRMQIEIDDDEDENFLQHFPATNEFIELGLDSGGAVLVHW